LEKFYERCDNEGGANPLRSRCALCCREPKCPTDELSADCQTEYDNAMANGNIWAFFERCETEGGDNPLRDRCSLCCHEGNTGSLVQKSLASGRMSEALKRKAKKLFAGADGCATDEVSDDCDAEWRNAHANDGLEKFYERCDNEGGANPLRSRCALCCREPKCPTDELSADCQTEYDNAMANGNIWAFFERCETEGGDNPLRDRCSLCCHEGNTGSVVQPSVQPSVGVVDGCALTEVSEDCEKEYENALANNDLEKFYKRCDNEGGANPLRLRCSLCCRDDDGQRP